MTESKTAAASEAQGPPAIVIETIGMFYHPDHPAFDILIRHGRLVASKAISAANLVSGQKPDIDFIWEASFFHDIGIFLTDTPQIGCTGSAPYICHGYLGGKIFKSLGNPRMARVCECHVGVGLSKADIQNQRLPLPARDMLPETLEEQIICYADKFFSKDRPPGREEKSAADIIAALEPFGKDKVDRFLEWHRGFSPSNDAFHQ